jgi:hypothetical protein
MSHYLKIKGICKRGPEGGEQDAGRNFVPFTQCAG